MTPAEARDPDHMPGPASAIALGLQHVLAMFVANLTPAIVLAGAAGIGVGAADPAALVTLIQVSMLAAGAATLLQTIGPGRIGARLPIVQGTSFAFLPVAIPVVAGGGAAALAPLALAALAAGAVQTALSGMVARLRFALPPLVTGLVVLMIGLSLMRVGVHYAAGGDAARGGPGYGAAGGWALAGLVIATTLALSLFARGGVAAAAVLIGLAAGYAAALAGGRVSFAAVAAAGWFAAPRPFPFGLSVSVPAILGFCLMGVVSAIESIGAVSAICEGPGGRPPADRELSGAVAADGVGTAIGALFGALPNTSFSQNVGLVAITGVMSRHVVTLGAGFLILCGLCPRVGALVATIPIEVLGGGVIVMFGMVAASALAILAKVEWSQRNMLIFATALSIGIGLELEPDAVAGLPATARTMLGSGVLPAAAIAIALNLIAPVRGGRAQPAG